MNSLGRIFRIHIFGESHGSLVGCCIDGIPAGIDVDENMFLEDLERRKGGLQKATTPRKEDDIPQIKTGIFNDKTTGAPLTILFENNNTKSADYSSISTLPRPSHADFVAQKKFNNYNDYRGGGHFSGRLTVALVAAGVIAKKILLQQNIIIHSSIKEIGGEQNLETGIEKAIAANDSVGGIVECIVNNLPIGLGEPFFDSVESCISHAVFAIPAIKGIEFGAGFAATKMFGSQHNDAIIDANGTTKSNNAGGIVGGLTNGNNLVFKVAVKPTASTPQPQETINTSTNNIETLQVKGRHDLCIALRVPVVVEAVTAMVLVDLLMINKKSI